MHGEAIKWAESLAESILADRPSLDWIALADRVFDALTADGYSDSFDTSADMQAAAKSAAHKAIAANGE